MKPRGGVKNARNIKNENHKDEKKVMNILYLHQVLSQSLTIT
ncbi:hypothetical protein ECDEC3F_3795 [Escherichia coli DEC3F]|nr:hypothetical protein ECDEC3B_3666 [Escherichia coli DEC3B]EHU68234.1 hypothetical protein ECDEC3C_3940 [Escherichia coli DEC3C]EHU73040.1 hypothetical protein ECDEC3D_3644 [Escherichia coli DEC3D]EHU84318.1 hypothetical protein ECDEC3F_3795 [Escherichia coli DEC3F]EHV03922.1 hypothetical protein ECDEC4D_3437 [Escherichia coli DEC4D]EHV05038.1 hypothetical protein ECDEC4C_3514 [Escherichia coli DEC4C]